MIICYNQDYSSNVLFVNYKGRFNFNLLNKLNSMPNLNNKVALITGARRGMGRAHALTLAKYGAKVVVTDISQGECQQVVEEINKQGGHALALKLDVTQKDEVAQVFQAAVQKFGRIDVLVNNAGIAEFQSFLIMSEEEWDKTLDINLKGQFLCAQ
ncbi:hypothetical protein COW86_04025, partial [Candidatus Kuenenbacteria bacterium CG22_combo_CG10-13_8_21_14_all_39_9]